MSEPLGRNASLKDFKTICIGLMVFGGMLPRMFFIYFSLFVERFQPWFEDDSAKASHDPAGSSSGGCSGWGFRGRIAVLASGGGGVGCKPQPNAISIGESTKNIQKLILHRIVGVSITRMFLTHLTSKIGLLELTRFSRLQKGSMRRSRRCTPGRTANPESNFPTGIAGLFWDRCPSCDHFCAQRIYCG